MVRCESFWLSFGVLGLLITLSYLLLLLLILTTLRLLNCDHHNHCQHSLLSQYRLCAAGIGLGTAYSLRYKKGLVPMVAAGAIGTTADMVYGYLVECAHFVGGGEDPTDSTPNGKGGGGSGRQHPGGVGR